MFLIFFKQMCAPAALFYLNDANYLMPVAIQLFPDPAPDNPVSKETILKCLLCMLSWFSYSFSSLFFFLLTSSSFHFSFLLSSFFLFRLFLSFSCSSPSIEHNYFHFIFIMYPQHFFLRQSLTLF